MADRSCAVYFLNYTPFHLRRRSYELEHGSWDVEPPEAIGPKAKTAREPNVFAWKSVTNWGLFGTEGFVEYAIQDRIENVFLAGTDARGVPFARSGTSGCIRIEFGSPFTGEPWCNVFLKACSDVLGSDDPSRFYILPTRRIHQGDGDLWKELVEVLPVGPLAVLTSWMSAPDHHPVYGSEFKLLVAVDDKRDQFASAGIGLTVDEPQPRYLQLKSITGGGETPWPGRWQSFLPDGKIDVDLEIRQQGTGTFVVDVTDNTRSLRKTFPGVQITTAAVVGYPGNVRRTPSLDVAPNRPAIPGLNLPPHDVATLNKPRVNPGQLSDVAVSHKIDEMVPQVDTLQLSDQLALHLYGLADLEAGGTIRGHAVQYVQIHSGEVISNLMLRQAILIR
jgi:hypothetical protein